jgi:soluble lytic murein transglycosylase-like protein
MAFVFAVLLLAGLAAPPAIEPFEAEAYFEGGPFESAQRMIVRGDTARGVQYLKRLLREHPTAKERPQARYLLGVSLIRLGAYEEAARLFDELASSYPVLVDDHRFLRGQALYLWKSYLDAAQVLAQVSAQSPRADEARRLRAWALLEATDFSRLARWLEQERRDGGLDVELTYVLALARHRTGDVLGAFRGLREVWQKADEPKLAGPALAALARLKIGDKPMLDESDRRAILAYARSLEDEDKFDDVMQKLERRLAGRGAGRLIAEVVYARGRVAKRRRRYRTAQSHFARAAQLAPTAVTDLRAKVELASAQMMELLGRQRDALRAYETIAARFADRPEAEAAMFRAAEIHLRTRKYKNARERCESLLLVNPVSTYRRRCVWNVGWGYFRLGQYARAKEFFTSVTKMQLPADLDGASRYWLARSQASLGDVEAARDAFRSIVERYPLSYYAALAEGQIAERLEEPTFEADGEGEIEVAKVPQALVQVREYARLGLRSRALAQLASFEKQTRASGRRIAEPTYHAMARMYEELGKTLDARRVREEGARAYPTALGSAAFVRAAKRAHPLKFEEPIRAAAAEFEIPVSLLFGLIRTESGFRPDAVSAMNAYGLAQLILPTARTVAWRLKAGRATKNRLLYDPAFNARLGAAYLRELLDRYEGSEVLALAAYNAGPNAVDAWTQRRLRALEGVSGRGVGEMPSPDELAEEIPVAETRAFVKVVLARARGYARLYPNEETPAEDPTVEAAVAAYAEPEHLPAPPEPIPRSGRVETVVGPTFVPAGDEGRIAGPPGAF